MKKYKQMTLRIRPSRQEVIEKKAWEFSIKEQISNKTTRRQPDALLWKGLKDITLDDVKKAMEDR